MLTPTLTRKSERVLSHRRDRVGCVWQDHFLLVRLPSKVSAFNMRYPYLSPLAMKLCSTSPLSLCLESA